MMILFNIYIETVLWTLICEGLANLRLFKYRNNINVGREILTTLKNSFVPIKNLESCFFDLVLFFSKKETVIKMANMIDIISEVEKIEI